MIVKNKSSKASLLLLTCFFVFHIRTQAFTQTILLDNFEADSIRVINPQEEDGMYRYLFNQYSGDMGGGPGYESITNETAGDGTRSLRITITSGTFYMQMYTCEIETSGYCKWRYMREFTQPPQDWKFNTFNRMRIWIKVPPGIKKSGGGNYNMQVGTYILKIGDSQREAESGNNHWYHAYDIPYTGEWHQVIVDTHPSYLRYGDGNKEWGNQEFPTEQPYNYFDLLTRWYVDIWSPPSPYPANAYFDRIELYRETRSVNIGQVYSLHGVYVPSTNEIMVGWQRNKDENTTKHEVRYAFQDIYDIGWDAANPAPNGIVAPLGWGGYSGMEWSTKSINVSGRTKIYIAIKPQNSNLFNQIEIPIHYVSPPAPPKNLRILQ